MAIPIAAISAGVGIAKKFFGKKSKRPDIRKAIAELRAQHPTGYLTPEDLRASELTRGRLNEGVNAEAGQAGAEIGRRFQARGLAGSPSEERARARLEQQSLLGRENAGNTAEEQLYNIKQGREAYQHQADLAIFGAQQGDVQREQDRQDAQNGAFWNSLNEFIPTIQGALPKGDTSGIATSPSGAYTPRVSGYDPNTQANPDTFLRRSNLR